MESGLTEFFQQLPPTLLIMLCGSALLLVVAVLFIVRSRSQRAQAALLHASAAASFSTSGADDSALPDLDLLLGADEQDVPVAEPARPAPAVAPAPARRQGAYPVTLPGGATAEVADVVTISRNLADGKLLLQVGDNVYTSLDGVTDDTVKGRLVSALQEIAKQLPGSKRATGEYEPPWDHTAAKQPAPPPLVPGSPMPGDLPKFNTDELPPYNPRKGKPPQIKVPEINIADAIESFLQFKLEQSPEFRGRNLHIRPDGHGGVRIVVDNRSYEAVGDVEDPATRQFLSETIQEWQARQ